MYCDNHLSNKGLVHEKRKFDLYIRDTLGKKEPKDLLALDIDRLRLGLEKRGKFTQAVRILELLRRTINYGIKKGLVDPISFKIEIPKLNNITTEDLSSKQLKKLLEVLDADEDQTAANVMRLALNTGMRRGELFKLRWKDIDFRRGFVNLKDPKGGSDQSIPLNDPAKKIFKNIPTKGKNPFAFPGRKRGTHLTDCKKSFKRIKKAAGLPKDFRPLHGLRHVYASRAGAGHSTSFLALSINSLVSS